MSYLRLAGILFVIVAIGLGIWMFYNRVIKNTPTTYQKAETMINPTYHYDYHPTFGFGCMRIPDTKELK